MNLRWFCNGCWGAWEEERKEKRLTTGRLLPEDRELWYTDTTQPVKLYDFDDNLSFKLSLHDQYRLDHGWFKVDIYSFTVETCLGDSSSSDSCFLAYLDEKPKQTVLGEASWFKSLDCVRTCDDEFSFDFSGTSMTAELPLISSLAQLPFIHFPLHMTSELFRDFQKLAREARAFKRALKELEDKRQLEKEELRRKQQLELQQKQKDLVQLAMKRAQNAQVKKITSPQPSQALKNNVWSSINASPILPLPQPASQWSSRPIVPPAMSSWSSNLIPSSGSSVPTLSLQAAVMQADPWSSANIRTEPQPKRIKTPSSGGVAESDEPSDDQRQRMARLGVPFRNEPKQ